MAFQKKAQEHAFKRSVRDIKEGKLPSLVVLCGREQYLVDLTIERIVKKFVNPATKVLDYTVFTDETFSYEAMTLTCETLSMFSERRVVVCRNFAPLAGDKLKGFSEEQEAAFCEYIKTLPPEVILILTCGEPDGRRKIYKACKAAGAIYDFDTLSEADLASFIKKQLAAGGKNCRDAVVREFIECSGYYNKETGYTLYNMANDVAKILSYAEGDEVTPGDVLAVVSGSFETYIFALIDSVSSGRRGEALRLLYNILASGEKVYRVLAAIASQYELMLEVKELREQGYGKDDIAKMLGVHEYRIKKALGFIDRYTMEALRRLLVSAYDVDRNIKNGLIEQNLALELLIVSA